MEWVADTESSKMSTSVKEFTKIDEKATSYSMNGIKANVKIQVQQDIDIVFKNPELKILKQTYHELLLTTNKRYKHYKTNEDRIIIKDGLIFRKNYRKTVSVKNYKFLQSKHLVDEVFRILHGDFRKHRGITKTIFASRQKYYHPKKAQLIREWVMSCRQCFRESRINRSFARSPLQFPNEHITAPEDAMQIDLVPELPPFGGLESFVTALDVFSRFSFTYPTSNQAVQKIAKVIINIISKYAYLPTTIIPVKMGQPLCLRN